MGAGMLGAFANLLPPLPDVLGSGWAEAMRYSTGGDATSKARKNAIHDVRTLRRREYQDMVHSLKAAGLNPMLAVGASPGHSAAQVSPQTQYHAAGSSGTGSAIAANRSASASNRQAGVAEKKQPNETKLTGAQAEVADLQRYTQYETTQRLIEERKNITANTRLALEQSGSARMERILKGAQAQQAGASARQIDQVNAASTGGNIVTDPLGYTAHAIEKMTEGAQDVWGKVSNTAKEAYKSWKEGEK